MRTPPLSLHPETLAGFHSSCLKIITLVHFGNVFVSISDGVID